MDRRLILIDGYNVIRRTPSLAAAERHSLRAAREALVGLVVARYRGTPHRVAIVFDGQGATESISALRCGVGSQQVYSAAGITADEVIRRLVDEARGVWGERITVYSDDWAVASHAASQGADAGAVGDLTQHLAQGPRHLRHRAQHHGYLRRCERDDEEDATGASPRPREGSAHKAPRRRRGR
jgi:predicted RNA-binding protein with PIN domain